MDYTKNYEQLVCAIRTGIDDEKYDIVQRYCDKEILPKMMSHSRSGFVSYKVDPNEIDNQMDQDLIVIFIKRWMSKTFGEMGSKNINVSTIQCKNSMNEKLINIDWANCLSY